MEMEGDWEFHWLISTSQTLEKSSVNALWHPNMWNFNEKQVVDNERKKVKPELENTPSSLKV